MDYQGNTENLINGYEILLVEGSCSTAWVSYTAGDPIPTGPVVAGKNNLTGRYHYVVASRDTTYMKLATYAVGIDQGLYRYGAADVTSFTKMHALIALS